MCLKEKVHNSKNPFDNKLRKQQEIMINLTKNPGKKYQF